MNPRSSFIVLLESLKGVVTSMLHCIFFLMNYVVTLILITVTTVSCLSAISTTKNYKIRVPLNTVRKSTNPLDILSELWNDPRPIGAVVRSNRTFVGKVKNDDGILKDIPYCVLSDKFQIFGESFQILLYPRGRFVGDDNNLVNVSGPAAVYLRYLPKEYGNEIDITYRLRLVDSRNNVPLPIATSGGLPRSNNTWSSAMTFCSEAGEVMISIFISYHENRNRRLIKCFSEAIESIGRATDWGSSSWYAEDVCQILGNISAELNVTVFDVRSGQSMISWPPFTKGGIGAVRRVVNQSMGPERTFRAGEVIVPIGLRNNDTIREKLQNSFVYGGIDYRIMTISDKDGNEVFSTDSLPVEERSSARIALRRCGWKTQRQLWQLKGMTTDWPVEIEAGLLSSVSLTRFNVGSALPRLISAFQRDFFTYTLALAIPFTPIPIALLARNVVSFYAIPSASMEPTLMRGDVLLVEKLPRAFERSKRGDVVLFEAPQSLLDIVVNNGSKIPSGSLFVKRIVGLPGDKNIVINEENDVLIDNHPVVGPDRSLCTDDPLKLIKKMINDGSGKYIKSLEKNEVYVLGDCKAVSVDSRVFGSLDKDKIVGKPMARVWPLNRWKLMGPF